MNELANAVRYFYQLETPTQELLDKHLTPDVQPFLQGLYAELQGAVWTKQVIHEKIEHAVVSNGLKFPKIAMPLRVMVTGGAQSPSIDAVMELMGKNEVLKRIGKYL